MIDLALPPIPIDIRPRPAFEAFAASPGSADRSTWLAVADAATSANDAGRIQPAQADPPLALGLNGIADWTPQQPFIDVMKTARPWTGHVRGQWGGWGQAELEAGGWLDAEGWPTAIPPELTAVEAILLTSQPEEADWVAGRYRLTYAGEGTIDLSGRVSNVVRRPGEIWFDFSPGEGLVGVQIAATDPRGTGEHIRSISIVKEDHLDLFEAGAVFNPRWLALVDGVRSLRFMDWMKTNDSPAVSWDNRSRPTDYTFGWRGVPVEVMVELANETATDPWFTMPHAGDDGYFRGFAEYVRDHLDPRRKAYVEYSNEVWNWIFGQAGWLRDRGMERWGIPDGDTWLQYAGMRAAQMADVWDAVFAAEADDRLVKVIATMTAWHGLEVPVLQAPRWIAEDPTRNLPPVTRFDAYAVTGYFGNQLGAEKAPAVREWLAESRAAAAAEADHRGLRTAAREAFLADHGFDAAIVRAAGELKDGRETGRSEHDDTIASLLGSTFPYQARVAREHGLDLVMYEGGTHVAGVGANTEDEDLTRFFIALNYSSEMGELYRDLLSGWREVGGTLFNAFVDVSGAGAYGSWGNLRHLQDSTPRWDALMEYNRSTPAGWEQRPGGSFDNGGLRQGTEGPERLEGGPHRDILLGRAGDDTMAGAGGHDRIHGGVGEDTVILPGRRTDYSFRREGTALLAEGTGGSARLVSIEKLAFDDDPTEVVTATLP